MKRHLVRISKRTGEMEWLGSPPPGMVLPAPKRQRFSEIIPRHRWLRLAFRILRLIFGEDGEVSEWTRLWPCSWEAVILMGKYRGARRVDSNRLRLIMWEQELWRTQ